MLSECGCGFSYGYAIKTVQELKDDELRISYSSGKSMDLNGMK